MELIQRTHSLCQRARVILEFENDLNQPPRILPCAGTAEADEAIREEILRRWARER